MNAVSHIDFPTLEDLSKYKDTIPCYDEVVSVIQAEIAKGNIVVHIGDAGCMPSETIVVVEFAYEQKCEYDKIKTCKTCGEGREYNYLIFSDRKGSTEIEFGGWKYRKKAELILEIQKQLERYSQNQ